MRLPAFAVFVIFAGFIISAVAEGEDASELVTVKATLDGVTLQVTCLKTFQTNGNVEINYSVSNESESIYKMLHANGILDVELDLRGPDGRSITGYHDMEGSTIGRGQFKRLFVEDIPPGHEDIGDSIPLSLYWPLEMEGEYRCVLTKRIYLDDPSNEEKVLTLRPGVPVDIVSPEFRFHIASIDESFRSRAADMVPSLNKSPQAEASGDGGDEEKLSFGIFQVGLSAVVLLAIGYLIATYLRRKNAI